MFKVGIEFGAMSQKGGGAEGGGGEGDADLGPFRSRLDQTISWLQYVKPLNSIGRIGMSETLVRGGRQQNPSELHFLISDLF